MYNGRYETLIDVIIKCKTHEECLRISKKVRLLCDAWRDNDVTYKENKSVNKGPVLERSIMITQFAYGHHTIILRETLNCILSYEIFMKTVVFRTRFTKPIDNQ